MKQLAMLVVAAMTGLLLVACGESAEKKPDTTTEVIVEQPATAAPVAAPEAAPVAAPEAAAPSDAAVTDAQTAE